MVMNGFRQVHCHGDRRLTGFRQILCHGDRRFATVFVTSIVMVTNSFRHVIWTVFVKFVVMVMDNCDGQLSTVSVKFIVMVMDRLQQFPISSLSRR